MNPVFEVEGAAGRTLPDRRSDLSFNSPVNRERTRFDSDGTSTGWRESQQDTRRGPSPLGGRIRPRLPNARGMRPGPTSEKVTEARRRPASMTYMRDLRLEITSSFWLTSMQLIAKS